MAQLPVSLQLLEFETNEDRENKFEFSERKKTQNMKQKVLILVEVLSLFDIQWS